MAPTRRLQRPPSGGITRFPERGSHDHHHSTTGLRRGRGGLRPALRLGEAFGSQSAVGDERANVAIRDLGGARRVLCYLWYPTSMTKWPRDFPSSYPTRLPTLRAVALGELAVDRFSY